MKSYLKTTSINIGEIVRDNRGTIISEQHKVYYTTLAKLEALGFEGSDVSLEISLFDYNMAWVVDKDDDDWYFIYRYNGVFDNGWFHKDTKWKEEFNWMSAKDQASFLDFLGVSEADFKDYPLPQKIYDLCNYWGYENIFGTGYGGGFFIAKDGRSRVKEYREYHALSNKEEER